MKKIPTLFQREYANHKVIKTMNIVTPGMEWVLNGEGVATVKHDGSCCAIIDGKFYKRYDAKGRKKVPAGSIPCCDPDPVTGHWPHWAPVDNDNPSDKWFVKALDNYAVMQMHVRDGHKVFFIPDGTYEAIGPHFQGNPYGLDSDRLVPHGMRLRHIERTFEGIRKWLEENEEEGLVFWLDGEPRCKIKRTDFGLEWPISRKGE